MDFQKQTAELSTNAKEALESLLASVSDEKREPMQILLTMLTSSSTGPKDLSALTGTTGRTYYNKHTGDAFELTSGVRQGDPFSPLFFALTLEPLLASLNYFSGWYKVSQDLSAHVSGREAKYANALAWARQNVEEKAPGTRSGSGYRRGGFRNGRGRGNFGNNPGNQARGGRDAGRGGRRTDANHAEEESEKGCGTVAVASVDPISMNPCTVQMTICPRKLAAADFHTLTGLSSPAPTNTLHSTINTGPHATQLSP